MTGDINDTVLNIGVEVAKGPQEWNGEVFSLIERECFLPRVNGIIIQHFVNTKHAA